MRKILILICSLLLALPLFAQEAMKVAILDPIDKEGNVPYAVKLQLRSSFASAISNTPGYEGYDRVNMKAIFGEQEFQRTGNVSDDQIRQIGVATGAAYVLVTEVAKDGESSIIIAATILDVETFGVKKSAYLTSGTKTEDVKKACETLAKEVLVPRIVSEKKNGGKHKKQEDSTTAKDKNVWSNEVYADISSKTIKTKIGFEHDLLPVGIGYERLRMWNFWSAGLGVRGRIVFHDPYFDFALYAKGKLMPDWPFLGMERVRGYLSANLGIAYGTMEGMGVNPTGGLGAGLEFTGPQGHGIVLGYEMNLDYVVLPIWDSSVQNGLKGFHFFKLGYKF